MKKKELSKQRILREKGNTKVYFPLGTSIGVTIKQKAIDGESFLQEEKSVKTTIPLCKDTLIILIYMETEEKQLVIEC